MRTRTVSILSVILATAVFFWAGPLAAQPSPTCTPNLFTIPKASRSHEVANEVYAPSVTAAIYLVNFVLLYMANPDLAAYMPAYRAPIPQPVVDCLEQNPMGCPWADYRRYFDEQVFDNRECFWPDVCQENARWARLAPLKARRPEQINEPLGRTRADQLAHLLGMDAGMILTDLGRHLTNEDHALLKTMAESAPKGGGLPPFKSIPQGAATTVWAATAPELAGRGGTYLADCAISSEHATWATDADAAQRLWTLSERLVGQSFVL